MSDDRLTPHAGRLRRHPESLVLTDFSTRTGDRPKALWKLTQLDDLAPAAAAPEAWLESEPAWSIAALK